MIRRTPHKPQEHGVIETMQLNYLKLELQREIHAINQELYKRGEKV